MAKGGLRQFLIGAVGGATVPPVQLGSSDFIAILSDASIYYLIGTMIRFVILAILGGFWVSVFNRKEVDPWVCLQLGIMPAALVALASLSQEIPSRERFEHTAAAWSYEQDHRDMFILVQQQAGQEEPRARTSELVAGITGQSPAASVGQVVDFSPAFRLVFFCVLGLTVFSALLNVFLAIGVAETPRVVTLVETYGTTWKLGFGAIIGLIGGNSLD